jgi:hypothetical protein
MPNGHQHTRAVYIVSHICGASCLPSVTNTLVTYISVLMYTFPRVHGVSPTHSCRIMCLICMAPRVHGASPTHSCCVKFISFKRFQSVPISSNQWQLIATDTPNTFNIALPPDSNEASSLTFCKNPHYLIRLISFELFLIITLPPLSRQATKIIPYSGLVQPIRDVSRPEGFLDLRKRQSLLVRHIFLLGSQLRTSEDVMVGTET